MASGSSFTCKTCNISISQMKHSSPILRRHASEPVETCKTCYHKAIKTIRPFVCHTCHETFRRKAALLTHISNAHKISKTMSLSAVMGTASNKKTVDPKPFPCADCGASFEFKQSLKKHEACNHGGGEYTHTCEVCFMAFKNPSTLKVHERTHTGEKPYTCETCGKSFRQKHHLVAHGQIHSGHAKTAESERKKKPEMPRITKTYSVPNLRGFRLCLDEDSSSGPFNENLDPAQPLKEEPIMSKLRLILDDDDQQSRMSFGEDCFTNMQSPFV